MAPVALTSTGTCHGLWRGFQTLFCLFWHARYTLEEHGLKGTPCVWSWHPNHGIQGVLSTLTSVAFTTELHASLQSSTSLEGRQDSNTYGQSLEAVFSGVLGCTLTRTARDCLSMPLVRMYGSERFASLRKLSVASSGVSCYCTWFSISLPVEYPVFAGPDASRYLWCRPERL
eukprot:jgi/Botrbrau1/22744/Bobra.0132s0077.1